MKFCPKCARRMISLIGSKTYLCRNDRCRTKITTDPLYRSPWDNKESITRMNKYEYDLRMKMIGREKRITSY